MNSLSDLLKRSPLGLLLVLLATSAVAVGLVTLRILWTGHLSHAYLVWNLFLAWTPLGFALVAVGLGERDCLRNGRFLAAGAGWLLFFPNAPYICTDLIHLGSHHQDRFWVDLILILLFALTGLIVGFASLHLMQGVVVRQFGRLAGWIFVAGVAGLSGWGVYIGRFLRWNSWDVVVNPLRLLTDLIHWLGHVPSRPTSTALPVLFAVFIFMAYLMVYALAGLNQRAWGSPRDESPQ